MNSYFYPSFSFIVALVVVTLVITTYRRRKNIQNMKSRDFAWYQANYPAHVTKNRVRCFSCNGGDIGTERIMRNTYMRAHVCRRCGSSLYFSPERG